MHILPPTGGNYRALSVTIEGATFRVSKRELGDAKLFCTCEVAGNPTVRCRTDVTGHSLTPNWNYEGSLVDIEPGCDLHFQIWRQEGEGKVLEMASGTLENASFAACGYEGDIPLRVSSGDDPKASLHVNVQPDYSAGGDSLTQVLSSGPRVAVTFSRPQPSPPGELTLHFTAAPLGMIFNSNVMPMAVKYDPCDGQAKQLGVKAGWVITRIDNVDVTRMPYEAAFDLFKERVKVLPVRR